MPNLKIKEIKTTPSPPYSFAAPIIDWYQQHKRNLPWRHTLDPYLIWLSEIILQQTRVAQGMPYYHRFVEAFPTVHDLAQASQQEVLRLWQGLGYYSRARNLHACAQIIVEQYDGKFPTTYKELLSLKGIGTYTAAAIASFAYNETVPVVDGNVYRVLSRVFGVKDDILSPMGQKNFRQLAETLVPEGEAHVYNQAIMEFGALQCTPTNPACLLCPVSTMCYAYQHGQQMALPVKLKKTKVKKRYLHYLVLHDGDTWWMKQRPEKGIWAGLNDFYLIETDEPQSWDTLEDTLLSRLMAKQTITLEDATPYKHQLTHQQLHVVFFKVQIKHTAPLGALLEDNGLTAYSVEAVKTLPKPILVDNYLHDQNILVD